jgi:hypothetical protein
MKNVIKYNKKIKCRCFLIMLFYLCERSKSKDTAPLHPFFPSVCSWIRKKVWCSDRVLECKPEDIGSRPGDVTFQTIHFCRRSSTFVKFCWKSSIFIVKLSSGMPKTFSYTRLNWSCVTRCWCRTTLSTFFTVYAVLRGQMHSIYFISTLYVLCGVNHKKSTEFIFRVTNLWYEAWKPVFVKRYMGVYMIDL